MKELENLISYLNKIGLDYDFEVYDSLKEVTIYLGDGCDDRHILHKIIIPKLPNGFQVSSLYPIGQNYKNRFTITKIIEEDNNDKDNYKNHYILIEWYFLCFVDSMSRSFGNIHYIPELQNKIEAKIKERTMVLSFNGQKNTKTNIFENVYKAQAMLEVYLDCKEWRNEYEKLFKEFEEREKELETKEKEFAERAKALDLLKQHLDKILINSL